MALRLWDIRTKKGLIRSSKTVSDSSDKDDLDEEHMKNVIVLTQKDCYHGKKRLRMVKITQHNVKHAGIIKLCKVKRCYCLGDTLGTMDTAEKGPFNQSQHPWYRPRTVALPLPMVAYRNGRLSIDASEMAAFCSVGERIDTYVVVYAVLL